MAFKVFKGKSSPSLDDQTLKRENSELKVTLASLLELTLGLCKELHEVRSQLQVSDGEVKKKFNEARICIEDLKSRVAVKMVEKSDDEDRLKKLSEELEATKGRTHQLEIERNAVKGQNEMLLKSAQTIRMKFDELSDVSVAIQDRNTQCSAKIRSLEGEIILLKEQMRCFEAEKEMNDSDCNNLRREKLQLIQEKLILKEEIAKLKVGETSNHNNNDNHRSFISPSKQKNSIDFPTPCVVEGASGGALNNSHDNGKHLVKQRSEPEFQRQQNRIDEFEDGRNSVLTSMATPRTDRLECSFCHHISSSPDELLKHGTFCNF